MGQLAENLQYFYRLESDTGTKLTDLRQMRVDAAPEERAEDDLHARSASP